MPRFRDSIRWAVALSATLTAWSIGAADEPADAAPDTAPVAAERPALPSRSDTIAARLLQQLPPEEVLSLKAGSDEFVALWRPANVAEPKGAIILVPGDGETADWPRGIGPLRRGLPDHGWHTLSLTLPDSPKFIPMAAASGAPADVSASRQSEAANEGQPDAQPPSEAGYLPEETATPPAEPPLETPEAPAAVEPELPNADPAEQINERIEAALAFARSKQPTTIVFLGQGTGAYWAARYLQQLAPADVKHLLMIQPRQPEGQQEAVAQLVPALKLATGDFYSEEGSATLSAARERLNASRRLQHPSYRQVKLPPPTGNVEIDRERLLRRIRGWLDKQ